MITLPVSKRAAQARKLLDDLQSLWVHSIEFVRLNHGQGSKLKRVHWLRNHGKNGGGNRYVDVQNDLFNRLALNISSVHYDDKPEKKLGSATALSCIVHPENPLAPSIHSHISWTELKNGGGSWRLMADLNPAIQNDRQTQEFSDSIKNVSGRHFEHGCAQGDQYFVIPALERHRGQFHFYLESHNSESPEDDLAFAASFGTQVISSYMALLHNIHKENPSYDNQQVERQINYHTLYVYQVVLLDRGTTSGLLVHNQNDLGILGSLPQVIDKHLLQSWLDKTQAPQDILLLNVLNLLPETKLVELNKDLRKELAETIRRFYKEHPQALKLQARGFVLPAALSRHND